MAEDLWNAVDDYLTRSLVQPDDILGEVLRAAREAGLPEIQVSATQGKFLQLLAKIHGARSVRDGGEGHRRQISDG